MKKQSARDVTNQAIIYLSRLEGIRTKLDMIDYSSTLDEFVVAYGQQNSEATATQISGTDSKVVARNKLLLDGYHVLSEIGSWVGSRSSTNYTVVVTSNIGVNEKVSWEEMPFEDFANMVDFSGKGKYGYSSSKIVLKDSQTLLTQYSSSAKDFGAERSWAYEQFDQAVRTLTTDNNNKTLSFKKKTKSGKIKKYKWEFVTRGNTLEAFLRYEKMKAENPNMSEHDLMYLAMKDTMAKPASFYQGGDIGNTQIKGDSATVANNSTILSMIEYSIEQLYKLIDILKTDYGSNISQMPTATLSTNISNALEEKINELISEFVDGILR